MPDWAWALPSLRHGDARSRFEVSRLRASSGRESRLRAYYRIGISRSATCKPRRSSRFRMVAKASSMKARSPRGSSSAARRLRRDLTLWQGRSSWRFLRWFGRPSVLRGGARSRLSIPLRDQLVWDVFGPCRTEFILNAHRFGVFPFPGSTRRARKSTRARLTA